MRYLILAALAAMSSLCQAATGVAFVHGTGKQTNATADYWQPTMVNNVRAGLPDPNNYVVINCDFTKYMWDTDAAGCLAGQLTNFIAAKNIDRLIIITHSNGGNVVRWILSNPTYDSRYPDIIAKTVRVNALAPSSAGTPLADAVINGNVFETSVGWHPMPCASSSKAGWPTTTPTISMAPAGGRRCRKPSAPWSAPMSIPRSGIPTVTAAAISKTSDWKPRSCG